MFNESDLPQGTCNDKFTSPPWLRRGKEDTKCRSSIGPSRAGIQYRSEMSRIDSTISVSNCLSTTMRLLEQRVAGLSDQPRVASIVESLATVFLARRSLRRDLFSENREYARFIRSLCRTTEILLGYEKQLDLKSGVKYHLDVLLVKAMRSDELPSKPSCVDGPLFTGWLNTFVRRQLQKRDLRFVYSLQKGCPQFWPGADEFEVKQAFEKHRKLLGFRKEGVPGDILEEIGKQVEVIFNSFEEIKSDGSYRELHYVNPDSNLVRVTPTQRSCRQMNRNNGGKRSLFPPASNVLKSPTKLGQLRDLHHEVVRYRNQTFEDAQKMFVTGVRSRVLRKYELPDKLDKKGTYFAFKYVSFLETTDFSIEKDEHDNDIITPNTPTEFVENLSLETLEHLNKLYKRVILRGKNVQPRYPRFLNAYKLVGFGLGQGDFVPSATTEIWTQYPYPSKNNLKGMKYVRSSVMNNVRTVALKEAGFKVRIITVGDGPRDVILQPVQSSWITRWKNSGFSTMRPEDSDLTDRITAHVKYFNVFLERNNLLEEFGPDGSDPLYFNSGDFQAATDNLKIDCTLRAVRQIRGDFKELVQASFLPGKVNYPPDYSIPPVMMQEGQLMGHPLSFPLLCIINLSTFNVSVDRWSENNSSRLLLSPILKRNVIINGDDIATLMPKSLYPFWKEATTDAGLIPSIGKNFFSPDCVQINSQLFKLIHDPLTGPRMERQEYLNQRLITGTSVKVGDSIASPVEVARELNRLSLATPWISSVVPLAMARWSSPRWNMRVNNRLVKPNWYLPPHLGGVGLDFRFGPACVKVTRDQRLLAARFLNGDDGKRLTLYKILGGQKSIGAIELATRLNSVKLVYGDYVPQLSEVPVTNSETGWFGRFTLLQNYCQERQSATSDLSLSTSKIKEDWRMKPVSLETLEACWRVRAFTTVGLPPVPPLPSIPSIRKTDVGTYNRLMISYLINKTTIVEFDSLEEFLQHYEQGSLPLSLDLDDEKEKKRAKRTGDTRWFSFHDKLYTDPIHLNPGDSLTYTPVINLQQYVKFLTSDSILKVKSGSIPHDKNILQAEISSREEISAALDILEESSGNSTDGNLAIEYPDVFQGRF